MNTVGRLYDYYPDFTPEVVEAVGELADRQKSFKTYGEFFNHMGINGAERVWYDGYHPVDFLDIRPTEHDPAEALVYHLPMANPLDPNMTYQAATIALANPDKRLIAFGNPSGPNHRSGLLNKEQRQTVINGNLAPVVVPVLKYLDATKAERVSHVGYSYGADTALITAGLGSQEVDKSVVIEPASVIKRSIGRLGLDFMSTNGSLNKYVEATETPTFKEARKDSVGPFAYSLGLARLTNAAIARYLARGDFESNLYWAMDTQERMKSTLIWGSESELALDDVMAGIAGGNSALYGEDRAKKIRLEGQTHSLANDIHLQAALVLEGLKN